jgi:hypothetical protein
LYVVLSGANKYVFINLLGFIATLFVLPTARDLIPKGCSSRETLEESQDA